MPRLSRIILYPIKSLDGVGVERAQIASGGALQYDRAWAICDTQGEILRAKRRPEMHFLRARYNSRSPEILPPRSGTVSPVPFPEGSFIANPTERAKPFRSGDTREPGPLMEVTLTDTRNGNTGTFCLDRQTAEIEAWLSQFFGFAVRLMRNTDEGFADDPNLTGPTVVSTRTIEEVASWFPGLDAESIRRRFRANLEIGDAPAFWEDQLYKQAVDRVEFEVGEVRLEGIDPCDRCAVITRDPETGAAHPDFDRSFLERRAATLPAWAERSRLPNFYHLCVRTFVPQAERHKSLAVGATVDVVGIHHDAPLPRPFKNFRQKHQQGEPTTPT